MELGRDNVRRFAGSYVHHLKKTASGYRIRRQRVDMTNGASRFRLRSAGLGVTVTQRLV